MSTTTNEIGTESSQKTTPINPTVHLNGSGFKNLSEQYSAEVEALRAALERMPVPHERDYYVQEPEAYLQARAEYSARVAKIREVLEEVYGILRDVKKQERARKVPT